LSKNYLATSHATVDFQWEIFNKQVPQALA